MSRKEKLVIAGMTLFGALIGAAVGGNATHMFAAAAAGLVGGAVVIVLDRSDPKQ